MARLERHYQMVKDRVGGRRRFDPRSLTPDQVAQRIAERKQRNKLLKKARSRPGRRLAR
ncbi:MAG TPA: hypothetical protein VGX76_02215 [Pirellulales bacterium]|nr:hypothetical protein [Pirellulales bacterium]